MSLLHPPPRCKRKRGAPSVGAPTFPIPLSSPTAAGGLWQYYVGKLVGSHVIIDHSGDADLLYRRGGFGKGLFSRGAPRDAQKNSSGERISEDTRIYSRERCGLLRQARCGDITGDEMLQQVSALDERQRRRHARAERRRMKAEELARKEAAVSSAQVEKNPEVEDITSQPNSPPPLSPLSVAPSDTSSQACDTAKKTEDWGEDEEGFWSDVGVSATSLNKEKGEIDGGGSGKVGTSGGAEGMNIVEGSCEENVVTKLSGDIQDMDARLTRIHKMDESGMGVERGNEDFDRKGETAVVGSNDETNRFEDSLADDSLTQVKGAGISVQQTDISDQIFIGCDESSRLKTLESCVEKSTGTEESDSDKTFGDNQMAVDEDAVCDDDGEDEDDSEEEEYCGDPYILPEPLLLSLEEAFFLSYGLGCLVVTLDDQPLTLDELYRSCSARVPSFPARYVAYQHFRAAGWVPKDGLNYGADFVLYWGGPTFTHSTYCVWVEDARSGQGQVRSSGITRTWGHLAGTCRSTDDASKMTLLCQVMWPDGATPHVSPRHLISATVKTMCIRRVVPSEEREVSRHVK